MAKRNYAGRYGTRQAIHNAQSAIARHQRAWELFVDASAQRPNIDLLDESEANMFLATTALDTMYRLGHSRRARAAGFSETAQRNRIGRDVGLTFTGYIVESPAAAREQSAIEGLAA